MNLKIVFYYMGWVLNIEAILMLLPCITSLIYGDGILPYFLIVMAICVVLGWIMAHDKPENTVFYAREGFLTTALTWVSLSIMGALPFWFSRQIPSLVDAIFETVSGFTTTGASILNDIEAMSPSLLMWRSFTHWVGGMGILVFVLAILPMAGGNSMYIMRAESPGPSVGKITPKINDTAKILYEIYLFMTLAEMVLLCVGGMPLFDSMTTAFGTAGTGGFAVKNISIAYYDNAYLQGVITVFMLLFGVNFNVYYLITIKRFKDAYHCEEVRAYLGIVAVSIILIMINTFSMFPTLTNAFRHVSFTVATIMTTTGFATVDFDQWPQFSKAILVGLMFIGACAGSTGGGMKVSRFIIWFKQAKSEISSLLHPRSVKVIRTEGKAVGSDVLRSVDAYLIMYIIVFAVSFLIVSLDNFDYATTFTSIAATINNIGPGLGGVGPTQNYADFSVLSKIVLMFDMLAGRLEVFPMLILFAPSTWHKL